MPESPFRIVVIGASAGGVEALCGLIGNLPADFPAAVLVALHAGAGSESQLPSILTRCGRLPAGHVEETQALEAGRVYVAIPNKHLTLERGLARSDYGPRVDRYRPSINRLFESAAESYGNQVIGIVLSGALHDGTLGMMRLKQSGGTAIVQDPDDALFSSMPQSALDHLDVDFRGSAGDISIELRSLVTDRPRPAVESAAQPRSGYSTSRRNDDSQPVEAPVIAGFTCPECGGVLGEQQVGQLTRYRCHVGHELSENALFMAQGGQLEQALRTALRVLGERMKLVQRAANRAQSLNDELVAARFRERNRQASQSAEAIRLALYRDKTRASLSGLKDGAVDLGSFEQKVEHEDP